MSLEETIVAPLVSPRPNPGGRLTLVSSSERAPAAERLWDAICLDKLSPLVGAALPLLNLCVQIKISVSHADIEGLRLRVLREIDTFERRVVPLGLAPRSIRASKYALSATIDDLVLNTPWGSRSIWTTRSMVGSLFSETWGGDRFFDLLTQLKKDPGVNVDLLELLYYCISLGFEGKYRIAPRGASELTVLREDLYRLIRVARGDFERDISPRWKGVVTTRDWPGDRVPAWMLVVATCVLLLGLYAALSYLVNDRSDRLFDTLATLPPNGTVSLARAAPPPRPPVLALQGDRLRRAIEPDIRSGAVAVKEDAQTITMLIRGAGMFDVATAAVRVAFKPLLLRIGAALNDQPGAVLLTGYTDATPIHTLAFPSNWKLSAARADGAAQIIRSKMTEPDRVSAEGRGDTDPIAPNTTSEGRGLNRRIELVITKARQEDAR